MIRITKETEYAFLLLSILLDNVEEPLSATTLAERANIAAPVTGKVLKRLVREGILTSTRGAYGGYRLGHEPAKITTLAVVQAMEGHPELVDCAHGVPDCALVEHCRISPFWRQLNDEITAMLKQRTLADMLNIEHQSRQPRTHHE